MSRVIDNFTYANGELTGKGSWVAGDSYPDFGWDVASNKVTAVSGLQSNKISLPSPLSQVYSAALGAPNGNWHARFKLTLAYNAATNTQFSIIIGGANDVLNRVRLYIGVGADEGLGKLFLKYVTCLLHIRSGGNSSVAQFDSNAVMDDGEYDCYIVYNGGSQSIQASIGGHNLNVYSVGDLSGLASSLEISCDSGTGGHVLLDDFQFWRAMGMDLATESSTDLHYDPLTMLQGIDTEPITLTLADPSEAGDIILLQGDGNAEFPAIITVTLGGSGTVTNNGTPSPLITFGAAQTGFTFVMNCSVSAPGTINWRVQHAEPSWDFGLLSTYPNFNDALVIDPFITVTFNDDTILAGGTATGSITIHPSQATFNGSVAFDCLVNGTITFSGNTTISGTPPTHPQAAPDEDETEVTFEWTPLVATGLEELVIHGHYGLADPDPTTYSATWGNAPDDVTEAVAVVTQGHVMYVKIVDPPLNADNFTWTLNGSPKQGPDPSTLCGIGELEVNDSCTITITPSNAFGDGNVFATTLTFTGVLAVPTGLALVAGDGQIVVNWDGAAPTPDYIEIYQSDSEMGTYAYVDVAVYSAGTYTISGLTNGETYWIKIRAATSDEVTLFSGYTAPVSGLPAIPVQMVGATISEDGLTLTVEFDQAMNAASGTVPVNADEDGETWKLVFDNWTQALSPQHLGLDWVIEQDSTFMIITMHHGYKFLSNDLVGSYTLTFLGDEPLFATLGAPLLSATSVSVTNNSTVTDIPGVGRIASIVVWDGYTTAERFRQTDGVNNAYAGRAEYPVLNSNLGDGKAVGVWTWKDSSNGDDVSTFPLVVEVYHDNINGVLSGTFDDEELNGPVHNGGTDISVNFGAVSLYTGSNASYNLSTLPDLQTAWGEYNGDFFVAPIDGDNHFVAVQFNAETLETGEYTDPNTGDPVADHTLTITTYTPYKPGHDYYAQTDGIMTSDDEPGIDIAEWNLGTTGIPTTTSISAWDWFNWDDDLVLVDGAPPFTLRFVQAVESLAVRLNGVVRTLPWSQYGYYELNFGSREYLGVYFDGDPGIDEMTNTMTSNVYLEYYCQGYYFVDMEVDGQLAHMDGTGDIDGATWTFADYTLTIPDAEEVTNSLPFYIRVNEGGAMYHNTISLTTFTAGPQWYDDEEEPVTLPFTFSVPFWRYKSRFDYIRGLKWNTNNTPTFQDINWFNWNDDTNTGVDDSRDLPLPFTLEFTHVDSSTDARFRRLELASLLRG